MKFIADLHIHSHFSIATSKQCIPEYLDYWARVKGITVIGTGDFTHPGWIKELKEKLEPAEQGLFKLKNKIALRQVSSPPHLQDKTVRFLLTAEISSIYKKKDKVRKVHNVIFAPDFNTVEKIQHSLTSIGGNITSDGRPILGLDSRDLLEIALNASENIFFVPAHIWTPWFSVLGSKSGFDTIEECYDDLANHIFAVETGLSSDPPMNWLCSFLDRYTLISNSDAHSPEKLGREANIFDTDLSYNGITDALKSGDPQHFPGTVEFFPQEGKYHYDGHRKCNTLWNPVETLCHNEICPTCNKKVTVGVMNRVIQLSDRENIPELKKRPSFHSVIPLKEILSEMTGVGPNAKKINTMYYDILDKAGSEFDVLLHLPFDKIKDAGSSMLAEAIQRMRNREVIIKEGFDGEFGQIKVFQEGEIKSFEHQESLFGNRHDRGSQKTEQRKLINFDLAEYRRLEKEYSCQVIPAGKAAESLSPYDDSDPIQGLNPEQRKAAEHFTGPALVLAGPGTGKTHVLTCRIAELVINKNINPKNILAVTFTNKAAGEMKERLQSLLTDKSTIGNLHISTFHAFGYSVLKKHCDKLGRNENFTIIDDDERRQILLKNVKCEKGKVRQISEAITEAKQNLKSYSDINDDTLKGCFAQYEKMTKEQNMFDLDDLIYHSVNTLNKYHDVCSYYRNKFKWVLIDEYQDINFSQYHMIKSITPDKTPNLFVIGDPNQAIYGFRGADVSFIKSFVTDFPETAVYKLKKSYRCTDSILQASGQVIQADGFEETVLEGLNKGVKITISPQNTDKSEAEFIARTIEEMIGGLRFFSIDSQVTEGERHSEITSLSDFAVLFRINRQKDAIEKAFNDHSIPYQTVEDTPFFKQEPIKSIISFLKLSTNPDNNLLRESLIEKLKITQLKVDEIINVIKNIKSIQKKVEAIIKLYFTKNYPDKQLLFKKLLDISKNYKNKLEQFITFADLGCSIDTYKPNTEAVSLMTLHSAKGLEFPCVFISGCEDGLLPYSIIKNQTSDYEEEKRLLYVGMTRAQKFLFITHAKKRFLFGKEHSLPRSPFLDSIEKELVLLHKSEYKRKAKEKEIQLSLFD